MKFSIERNVLIGALAHVTGVVARKNTIPILSCVLIDAAPGQLTIRATNLDMEATVRVDATVSEVGSCCVAGSMLADIAKNAAEGADIALDLGKRLAIKTGRSRFNLAVQPTSDFPSFPAVEGGASFTWRAREIGAVINRVAFAQGADVGKAYLCGVRLFGTAGLLGVAATNGKHIAIFDTLVAAPDFAITVPTAMVNELKRMLDTDGDATVSVSPTKLGVMVDGVEIIGKLVDGNFADFRGVVARTKHDATATLAREELAGALRRVMLAATDQETTARLALETGAIVVTAKGQDADAEDSVACDYDGEPIMFGVNAAQVLQALAAIEGDDVEIRTGPHPNPFRLSAPGDDRFMVLNAVFRA